MVVVNNVAEQSIVAREEERNPLLDLDGNMLFSPDGDESSECMSVQSSYMTDASDVDDPNEEPPLNDADITMRGYRLRHLSDVAGNARSDSDSGSSD